MHGAMNILKKKAREWRPSYSGDNEDRDNRFVKDVGVIYQTTRRHMQED